MSTELTISAEQSPAASFRKIFMYKMGWLSLQDLAPDSQPSQLPEGFMWDGNPESSERADLLQSVGWEFATDDFVRGCDHDFKQRGIAIHRVGVRNDTDRLVGYGAIAGLQMCDFAVRPGFQGNGIGKAIIDERLRQADILRMPLRIDPLLTTNTLAYYYKERGFVQSDSGRLVRRRASRRR